MTISDEQLCACGRPLHYSSPTVQRQVETLVVQLGEFQPVTVEGLGTWRVQRHYMALHGLKAEELPTLGLFEKIA